MYLPENNVRTPASGPIRPLDNFWVSIMHNDRMSSAKLFWIDKWVVDFEGVFLSLLSVRALHRDILNGMSICLYDQVIEASSNSFPICAFRTRSATPPRWINVPTFAAISSDERKHPRHCVCKTGIWSLQHSPAHLYVWNECACAWPIFSCQFFFFRFVTKLVNTDLHFFAPYVYWFVWNGVVVTGLKINLHQLHQMNFSIWWHSASECINLIHLSVCLCVFPRVSISCILACNQVFNFMCVSYWYEWQAVSCCLVSQTIWKCWWVRLSLVHVFFFPL